jgi:hypothetical protein
MQRPAATSTCSANKPKPGLSGRKRQTRRCCYSIRWRGRLRNGAHSARAHPQISTRCIPQFFLADLQNRSTLSQAGFM